MKPYHKNPRQIKQKRFDALTDTLDRLGDLGGIVHNQRTDEVIGGNQRTRVFSEASEVQLIEIYDKPDRQGTIAHGFIVWRGTKFSYRLVDWDEATCEEANIKANLGAGDWDWGKIADEWTDVAGFKDWFDADLLRDWGRDYSALALFLASEEDDSVAGDEQPDTKPAAIVELDMPGGVPDTIWPTDNEYGIPMLDITRQADAFDLPIETWGAKGRTGRAGTYHFYTEDYRFSALWQKPGAVLDAGCVNIVEPNYSIYKDFPPAVAIYRTYQKRWLARYWQSQGVRVFVDLNVNPDYYDVNFLGVPDGWRAFATRGYGDRLHYTELELQKAKDKAAGESVLFLVYGGGKKVKAWCEAHAVDGVVWVSEDMDKGKGKYTDF